MAEILLSKIPKEKAISGIEKWMNSDNEEMADCDALQLFYWNTDALIEYMEDQGFDVNEIKQEIKNQMEIFNEPVLVEAKVTEVIFKLKELAQNLLNILNGENEEFQDMAIGSAIAPVIEGFRSNLQGALAIIPRSKGRHNDK